MKILFIIPPYLSYNKFVNPSFSERVNKNGYGSIISDAPLGVISISSYLKNYIEDISIDFIDFNVELNKIDTFDYSSFKEFFEIFFKDFFNSDNKYDLIGISTLFTTAYFNLIDLGNVIKKLSPESMLISGGGVATNLYKRIYEDTNCFDALCFGEGERCILELLQSEDKFECLNNNSSWITPDKIKLNKTYEFSFINDLDEIPFYDYDLCDPSNYMSSSLQSLFPLLDRNTKSVSYMASRGCVHKCCFCASHTVHGRKMRMHSLDRIEKDFKILKEKYNIGIITFLDDHFMHDKQRVYDIVDILKKLDLKAFFPSSLALYKLDKNILKALKSVGLGHIILSVESGSNRVLQKIMHKPLNLNIVERVIKDCNDLGISTDISILIGLVGETKQDIEDAEKFFETINPSWYRFSVATPLVGSELFNKCLENNCIEGDYISCDFKTGIIKTEDFTPEYLQEKLYEMNLKFNFVNNNDIKNKNYKHALREFENTISATNGKHAFAYYYASMCHEKLGNKTESNDYINKYVGIIEESSFWKDYSDKFKLQRGLNE